MSGKSKTRFCVAGAGILILCILSILRSPSGFAAGTEGNGQSSSSAIGGAGAVPREAPLQTKYFFGGMFGGYGSYGGYYGGHHMPGMFHGYSGYHYPGHYYYGNGHVPYTYGNTYQHGSSSGPYDYESDSDYGRPGKRPRPERDYRRNHRVQPLRTGTSPGTGQSPAAGNMTKPPVTGAAGSSSTPQAFRPGASASSAAVPSTPVKWHTVTNLPHGGIPADSGASRPASAAGNGWNIVSTDPNYRKKETTNSRRTISPDLDIKGPGREVGLATRSGAGSESIHAAPGLLYSVKEASTVPAEGARRHIYYRLRDYQWATVPELR